MNGLDIEDRIRSDIHMNDCKRIDFCVSALKDIKRISDKMTSPLGKRIYNKTNKTLKVLGY